MPEPRRLYDTVLHAARDLVTVGTALEAELTGAALLGGVYAVSPPPRADALRTFVSGFLGATARRRTPAARATRAVFASLVPEADGAVAVPPAPAPWSAHLGRVRPVGTWAYGDVYGDQTGYVASFAYDDPSVGGPDHAVVVLVDHNLGVVKDLVVSRPADRVLAGLTAAAEADDLIWFRDVDPATFRSRVSFHLGLTDSLTLLPDGGALATDRALVGSRLATLPPADPAPAEVDPLDPDRAEAQFLDSPQAVRLERATPAGEAAVRYAVRLILEFTQDSPDRDPVRWSPAVVGLFLLDWVHRRAVLDEEDVATLPVVLRAWTAWAAERRGLPPVALRATGEAIDTMVPEFLRRHRTGGTRGEAAVPVGRPPAGGVDPDGGGRAGVVPGDDAAVRDRLTARRRGAGDVPRPR
ncbi:MAG: hypothetical protein FWJ70_07045 [Micromonosporaceae bacterium]|jgi:hypothetical protein